SLSVPGEVASGTNRRVAETLPPTASPAPPIPISYSLGRGSACHIDNSTVPAQLIGGLGTGTCVLIITIGDSTVIQTVTITRTYLVKNAQTIAFPAMPAQSYSPGGTFTVSATASSGLPVTFSSM